MGAFDVDAPNWGRIPAVTVTGAAAVEADGCVCLETDAGPLRVALLDCGARLQFGAAARDYEILTAGNRAEALEAIRTQQPRVVILDLGLPPHPASTEEGFATLAEAITADPHIKVVIVTGRAEKEHAMKAIAQGAYDILYKPVQLDELGTILRRAYHVSALEREHTEMQQRIGEDAFEGMLGTSPKRFFIIAYRLIDLIHGGVGEGLGRSHCARRDRPTHGARHLLVVAAVDHVVDGRGARGREPDADRAEDQRGERWQPGHREEHAHHRRKDDERDDLGLAELEIVAPGRGPGGGEL